MSSSSSHEPGERQRNFLLIANISKLPNVVALLYSALSFDFFPIIVGLPAVEDSVFDELRPTVKYLRFELLAQAKAWLSCRRIMVVGIEIMSEARNLLDDPFPPEGRVALMPGNEGTGLSTTQKSICDGGFVFIPQYGAGTASLNVTIATSLVLHQYREWQIKTTQYGRTDCLSDF